MSVTDQTAVDAGEAGRQSHPPSQTATLQLARCCSALFSLLCRSRTWSGRLRFWRSALQQCRQSGTACTKSLRPACMMWRKRQVSSSWCLRTCVACCCSCKDFGCWCGQLRDVRELAGVPALVCQQQRICTGCQPVRAGVKTAPWQPEQLHAAVTATL